MLHSTIDIMLQKCSNEYNIDGSVRRDSRYHLVVGDYGYVTKHDGTINYNHYSDTELVAKLLSDHHIDTIVHFAAQTHVDVSYANPIATVENNVVNFTRFLQTVTEYGKVDEILSTTINNNSRSVNSCTSPPMKCTATHH
jgi:UDP-glucose 4-epimerase